MGECPRRPLLPTGRPFSRANKLDFAVLMGGENFGAQIASVHQVLNWNEIVGSKLLMDRWQGRNVAHSRAREMDVGDQLRAALITGFAEVDPIAQPGLAAVRCRARVRVIR